MNYVPKTVKILVLKMLQYTDRTLLQLWAIKYENKLSSQSKTASPLIPHNRKISPCPVKGAISNRETAQAVFTSSIANTSITTRTLVLNFAPCQSPTRIRHAHWRRKCAPSSISTTISVCELHPGLRLQKVTFKFST